MTHAPACRTLLLVLAVTLSSCARHHTEAANLPVSSPPPVIHEHHTIDYIELTVTDMAEAQRFYTQALGWSFTDYGPDYAGIRRGDGEAGGLRLDTALAAVTGGPLVVIYSDDLDASLAAVRAAGGRIKVEPFAFPGGRRFQFLDPSGNELAIYASD